MEDSGFADLNMGLALFLNSVIAELAAPGRDCPRQARREKCGSGTPIPVGQARCSGADTSVSDGKARPGRGRESSCHVAGVGQAGQSADRALDAVTGGADKLRCGQAHPLVDE